MIYVLAFLMLVIAPLLIIGDVVNKAVQRHNNDVKRQNMGEW
jgi:Na+-transporting methylmalonyl-CoA/oxaloacetate decarboxylase gamma subunit